MDEISLISWLFRRHMKYRARQYAFNRKLDNFGGKTVPEVDEKQLTSFKVFIFERQFFGNENGIKFLEFENKGVRSFFFIDDILPILDIFRMFSKFRNYIGSELKHVATSTVFKKIAILQNFYRIQRKFPILIPFFIH